MLLIILFQLICIALAIINLSNNVTNIKEGAFINCSALTSITIPKNVSRIEDNAFTGCTSLTRVDMKATTPPTIFSATFGIDNTNLKIYVPADNINAYKVANYWKELNILAQQHVAVFRSIGYTGPDTNSVAADILPAATLIIIYSGMLEYQGYKA